MTTDRMTNTNLMKTTLIAPCGMNCRLCLAYIRDKKACPGCLGDNRYKTKARARCIIRNCEKLVQGNARYCFSCDSFPCARLKQLDKRYRTKYGMSMIDNLEHIREFGIRHFIQAEKGKWTCPECGQILCVHRPQCLVCKHKW